MNASIDNNDILIRTLPTPNPYALKFVANVPFKTEGKATFHSPEECPELPLVRDMFYISGVKQVYLFENTITVTHDGSLDNDELADHVTAVVRTRGSSHNPNFGPAAPVKTLRTHENPVLMEIEEILDRTIRPGLQADGGDIEVVSLEGNELKILYQGACGGCPSSLMGTLDAIQGILRNELNNSEMTVTPI